MLDQKKPPLEELTHYGVKGMRWGVRRSDAQLAKATKPKGKAGKEPSKSKQKTNRIKQARGRSAKQEVRVQKAKAELLLAENDKQRKGAAKKLETEYGKYVNSPDRTTAARMTRGQKAAVGAGALLATVMTTPVGGAAFLAGAAGGNKYVKSRVRKDRKRFNDAVAARDAKKETS